MSDLPYPTKTRLSLADAIDRGEVKHIPFVRPYTLWESERVYRTVTAATRELVAAGLAEIADGEGQAPRPVSLTDAGRAWRDAARAET